PWNGPPGFSHGWSTPTTGDGRARAPTPPAAPGLRSAPAPLPRTKGTTHGLTSHPLHDPIRPDRRRRPVGHLDARADHRRFRLPGRRPHAARGVPPAEVRMGD